MTCFEEEKSCATSETDVDGKNTELKNDTICFFGGDISFDEPQVYDDTPDRNKKIKSVFSMTHFSLFVYLLTSQGVATLLLLFASLFFVANGAIDMLSGSADFMLGLNAVCQYVIAFPILILLTKGVEKKETAVKRKMGIGEFFVVFVIAEGLMLLGALVATLVSDLFGKLFGVSSTGAVDSVIGNANPMVVFVAVCILAPIFEELIFRKILIDRLSLFGDGIAIVFSAIAFGLFHGNLSQLIYATAVGLVLGYVYTSTRKIKYTILLHAMLNFFGGVLPIGVEWIAGESKRLHTLAKEGEQINTSLAMLYDAVLIAYNVLTVLLILGAITALVIAIIKKKIAVEKSENIGVKDVVKTGVSNAGFILFVALCAVLIIISLLTT